MTSFAHRTLKKAIKSGRAKQFVLTWDNCWLPEKEAIVWLYRLYLNKRLDLDHPVTYNEKLQWYKAYYHDPLMTMCADKIEARRYVEACGLGEIVTPLIGVWGSADEIDFDGLPSRCFLKCNHNSDGAYLWDRSRDPDIAAVKGRFKYMLAGKSYYYGREWAYKDIAPKVFAEELIEPKKGTLTDWNVFCFYGEPKIVLANKGLVDDTGRHAEESYRLAFDTEFNELDIHTALTKLPSGSVAKPVYFERMLEYARILSGAFPHVRVDFFGFDDEVRFGEMTFYSGGGYSEWKPEKWGELMGGWFALPERRL